MDMGFEQSSLALVQIWSMLVDDITPDLLQHIMIGKFIILHTLITTSNLSFRAQVGETQSIFWSSGRSLSASESYRSVRHIISVLCTRTTVKSRPAFPNSRQINNNQQVLLGVNEFNLKIRVTSFLTWDVVLFIYNNSCMLTSVWFGIATSEFVLVITLEFNGLKRFLTLMIHL